MADKFHGENHKRKIFKADVFTAMVFVAPLVIFMAVFILLPVSGTLLNSLYQDVAFLEKKFVFFKNFQNLLSDESFYQSVRFTVLFVAVTVPLELCLGILFALLLDVKSPLRAVLRGCILIPWAIPAAVSARTWQLIYNYSFGLANYIITSLGITDQPVNFLGTKLAAFAAVVIADTWKTTPFVAIIVLAGLQTIPGSLYEQARIDGASAVRAFFKITVPLLKQVLIVSLLFRTIDAIRVFDIIYVLTGGGPGGATTSVSHYAYKYFLSGDFGFGSAASVVIFLAAFILSIIYIKAGKFTEEFA
jgi:multiple sugar transport system permease protein